MGRKHRAGLALWTKRTRKGSVNETKPTDLIQFDYIMIAPGPNDENLYLRCDTTNLITHGFSNYENINGTDCDCDNLLVHSIWCPQHANVGRPDTWQERDAKLTRKRPTLPNSFYTTIHTMSKRRYTEAWKRNASSVSIQQICIIRCRRHSG